MSITTIDAAGRIVVPKALRDELGLTPGTELEVVAADGALELSPLPTPMHLEGKGPLTVAVADEPMPPLWADQVRATLEGIRR
ncbi:MAG: AbrB/MazE/SpoVT family DNA-binding domain-containing protein [Actinomycetota bacterium]